MSLSFLPLSSTAHLSTQLIFIIIYSFLLLLLLLLRAIGVWVAMFCRSAESYGWAVGLKDAWNHRLKGPMVPLLSVAVSNSRSKQETMHKNGDGQRWMLLALSPCCIAAGCSPKLLFKKRERGAIKSNSFHLGAKRRRRRIERKLPVTTWNETLAGAMLDGAHWYCPESSGETLGSVSVIANESFPVRSRTVERPVLSELAATTQLLLLSPFPRENCTKSQESRRQSVWEWRQLADTHAT